jgi:hypothetical protein
MSTQRFTLFGLCLLSVFYLSFAKQWVSLSMRDKTFNEYTSRMVQLAAQERRPTKDVRDLLLVKAEELSMPLRYDQIQIGGIGRTLHVGVHYEDDIILPVLNRRLIRRTFEHNFKPNPQY